ncbi:uncharacterized protein LOC122633729 isoform X2 [Vespula pensylvanica]|uniref:uncharacterized protein LOC122633729 isoform X2 n=1 Tax=Vespula pensylvanica TaxID=30213 RepID=UPI001CBA1216|nr:uncharacterized protein LOC122633729 isoform X2 [Vespula pensylvanica]
MIMARSDFRVKVDLSKYYHDIRRFCWVFVDGTKILQISDMKKHIKKLFNIREPYHLCLNNTEYLPPFEDARIIKENETIIVIPGSGLEDEIESSINFVSPSIQDNDNSENKGNKTFNHKETQTVEFSVMEVTVPTKDITIQSNELLSDSKQDSKTMNSTITEDYSFIKKQSPSTKRKRVRHRKGKKNISTFIQNPNDKNDITKKPKIVDSLVLSSGKHIRFDTSETNEIQMMQQFVIEPALSKLISLRNSSTPLTFPNKKIKEEIVKPQNISTIEVENIDISNEKTNETLNNTVEKNTSGKEINHDLKNQSFSDIELEQYPPVKMQDVENNDIIAFKMLRIGEDYSPHMSNVIIAQVMALNQQTSIFTLKIIKGLDQIYNGTIPSGKFSILEPEMKGIISNILNINYSHMMEPCFIKKSSSNNTNTVS